MKTEKATIIVGGGIIGLFTAYYLHKSGRKVLVFDGSDGQDGCSYGNAGMIVPSHFVPLASPGIIEKGLKWLLDSESPFYIQPKLSMSLLKWGLNFYKAATEKKMHLAVPHLKAISLLSKEEYQKAEQIDGLETGLIEKGLIMYCKTEKGLEEEAHTAEWANKIGIQAKVIDAKEIHVLEPNLKANVSGGVFFEGDAHLNPGILMTNLKTYLLKNEVEIFYNSKITDFETTGAKVSAVMLGDKKFAVEDLIIATGSWSENMAKKLGIYLPVQAGKGYSVSLTQNNATEMMYPGILTEARVAMTPMAPDILRIGGTMEISGINLEKNMNRVRGIIKSVPAYFENLKIEMPEINDVWVGLRPCSPDGLPYIGSSQKFTNLYFNTGHAMMGVSLAPGSGKLIAEIINKRPVSMDVSGFKPERFA
jgi:D-amino-acid dehydrogenase